MHFQRREKLGSLFFLVFVKGREGASVTNLRPCGDSIAISRLFSVCFSAEPPGPPPPPPPVWPGREREGGS